MRSDRTTRTVALSVLLIFAFFAIVGMATAPATAQETGGSWNMTVSMAVNETGDVVAVQLVMEFDNETAQQIEDAAADEGYDDPAVWFADDMQEQNPQYVAYSDANFRRGSDGATMTILFDEVDVSQSDSTNVTTEGDRVTVVTEGITDPATDENLAGLSYRYHMPGEITDTNAIETDENLAIWRLHEDYQSTLRVESMRQGSAPEDEEKSESAGMDMVYDITVAPNGSIEEARFSVNVDDETHQQFEAAAQQQGLDSGAEWMADYIVQENEQYVAVRDTSEQDTRKGTRMILTLGVDGDASENITTTVEDGTVSVQHTGVDDPASKSDLDTVIYRYHMPGDVTQSNAYDVVGNTATWRLHEDHKSTLRVASRGGVDDSATDGPATDGWDLSVNMSVTSEGEVSRAEVGIDTTDETYQQFRTHAQ